MEDFNTLNKNQQQVVTTTQGPVLVLAGAGSGKTRSIIFRALYLISVKKVRPWQLLIVTFTNKAAKELKSRLSQYLNYSLGNLWVGTFHSLCLRILDYEINSIPLKKNFTIYDADDQKQVFKKIYKKLDIDDKHFTINRVRSIISQSKNSLIKVDDFFAFNEENYYTEKVHKIYQSYQDYLLKNNAVDFDDLLLYTAFLLDENEDIRKKYAIQFQYIMIDEYQDTNYAQFKIVHSLAKDHENICVVGDDDQAIYSWRGATIKNILHFEDDYSNVKTIKLEQNYRSHQTILELANSLIKKNSERHSKELWSEKKSEEKPNLMVLENENEEAEFVAKKIQELHLKNQISYNQMAVLYRTNAQSRNFEIACAKHKLPYQIIGGVHFYQRKEIKDLLAYLRMLANPADNESILRIINFPRRGIGKKTIQAIVDYATQSNQSITEVLFDSNLFLWGAVAKRVQSFYDLYEKWLQISQKTSIISTIESILEETKMLEMYQQSKDPKDINRAENLQELVAAIQEFSENYEKENKKKPNLSDFLQLISLQTDLDSFEDKDDSVKLMTMHNAKGLEFESVFIVGLEDGLLPHSRSQDSERMIEEERRLLYVAITRAKEYLYLTYTRFRRIYNSISHVFPSRFITDLNLDFINQTSAHFYDFQIPIPKRPQQTQKVFESAKFFNIGQKIIHAKFGEGIILNVEGVGENAKLTISFSSGSLKKIIGSYVKLI